MDLKDYLRVIRRRMFQCIIVFVVIISLYWYVSKVEKTTYIANAVLQIGAKGYNDSTKNKHTFLRNAEDFKRLLSQKDGDSIYVSIAQKILTKMKLTQHLDPEKLDKETVNAFLTTIGDRKNEFYKVTKQVGFESATSQFENVRDLVKSYQYLLEQQRILKEPKDDKVILQKLFSYATRVSPIIEEGKLTNSVEIHVVTENEYLSRLLVNEVAFFAQKKFNDKNKEQMIARADKINRWWRHPEKSDLIEQIYNGVVVKYKQFRTAMYRGDKSKADRIERDFIRQFQQRFLEEGVQINSFNDAFDPNKVDEMHALKKEYTDINSRYNNLRTWGVDGNAKNVVSNETEVSQQIQALISRVNAHNEAITSLGEERELLKYKFTEIDPHARELMMQTNARLTNLLDQVDKEEIALDDLETRYTAQHPKVIDAKKNIESLKKYIEKIREDLSQNDYAKFDFNIRKINVMIDFNRSEIRKLETVLEEKRKEMEQINDMKLHLSDITDERKRILDRINDNKEELAALNTQIALDKIIDIHRFSRVTRPGTKTYTRQTLYLAILFGVIMSIVIAYFLEYMDTNIKTEHDVRRHMNLPVLSMIGKAKKEVILTELPSKDPFAEHFNTAATLVRSAAQDLGLSSFLVTSTVPQEGKTTICVDLAIALARKGLRTIVVDGDLRIPTIHEVLEIDNSTGLSTILEGRSASDDSGIGVESYLKPTSIENLRVLTSGPIPADPINLLESARMKALIEELKDNCDYLIIDTPPIYNVGDTLTMASLVDATLFVVGSERVEQDQVTWAKHLLSNVNANILGVFLNMVRVPGKTYYYYYNGYKSYRSRG
jgi:capsular exopolysaccharide synthesis family protein